MNLLLAASQIIVCPSTAGVVKSTSLNAPTLVSATRASNVAAKSDVLSFSGISASAAVSLTSSASSTITARSFSSNTSALLSPNAKLRALKLAATAKSSVA